MGLITVNCVTVNALDPGALAEFWAGMLGGTPRDAGNGFVLVEPGAGRIPLLFQKVEQPVSQPGWVHLDCSAPDRDAAIAEICRRGGWLIEKRRDSNGEWTVMSDPEGNPFCI
jgi:hypothetical protein